MGVLTAMLVVFSQLFFFEAASYAKKEIKTEKQENQPGDELTITLPSFSQPSSVNVELHQKSFCLFEILFEKSNEERNAHPVPLLVGKFFQTLFRVIISPNAP